jgi:hypothetical protein
MGMCVAAPAVAQAQTVVANPGAVEFNPSADHAALGLDGVPLVDHYALKMFLEGATDPVQTIDLGKPAPDQQTGKITCRNAAWFAAAAIVPNVRYVAKVAAVGPTGEGVSDSSNPFGRTGPPAPPPAPPTVIR